MKKKVLSIALMSALSAALLAGCGGKKKEETESTNTNTITSGSGAGSLSLPEKGNVVENEEEGYVYDYDDDNFTEEEYEIYEYEEEYEGEEEYYGEEYEDDEIVPGEFNYIYDGTRIECYFGLDDYYFYVYKTDGSLDTMYPYELLYNDGEGLAILSCNIAEVQGLFVAHANHEEYLIVDFYGMTADGMEGEYYANISGEEEIMRLYDSGWFEEYSLEGEFYSEGIFCLDQDGRQMYVLYPDENIGAVGNVVFDGAGNLSLDITGSFELH